MRIINQSELVQNWHMMELAEKNMKSNYYCIPYFKKLEERLSRLSWTMEVIFLKTQIEYLEIKSTTSEIKNKPNGLNYSVDIA